MDSPNIVYVFADQWPAFALGYAGDPNVKTPHLDAFAKEAVNCRFAVANTPVCTPSRATLLTGQLPDRHGLFLNDAPLNPELETLGEFFDGHGYDTAYVGKWHVDGHGRIAYIPPERQHRFRYWKTLECTHNYNASRYYQFDDPTQRKWETYDAIAQSDDVIEYIRSHRREQPFFLMLSWGPPHNPYHTAPECYKAMYDEAALELRPNVPEDHRAARPNLAGFYSHCTALDDCFGRILASLKEKGIEENTIVIFTSDHGDHLGAHYLGEKQSPLEESLRIPFLVRWPGKLEPHVNDSLFSVLDVFPTSCGLLGLEKPAQLQGRDFSDHWRNRTTPDDTENDAFCASYHSFGTWPQQHVKKPVPEHLRSREYRGIRTTRYTYCESLEGPWLFFDNEADPFQLRNLIDSAEHEVLRNALAARLHRRLEGYGDSFRPGMEYVRRWGYEVDEKGTIPIHDGGDWKNIAASVT